MADDSPMQSPQNLPGDGQLPVAGQPMASAREGGNARSPGEVLLRSVRRYSVVGWVPFVLTLVVMAAFDPIDAPAGGATPHAAVREGRAVHSGRIVRMTGEALLDLSTDGGQLVMTEGALAGARISIEKSGSTTTIALIGAGGSPLAVLLSDGSSELRLGAGEGSPEYLVRVEDEGFTVLSPGGMRLFRAKCKEAKVNVYGATEERIRRVKEKKGSWVIRTEDDRDLAWVSFDVPLESDDRLQLLAALAIPIAPQYRALLLAHFAPVAIRQH